MALLSLLSYKLIIIFRCCYFVLSTICATLDMYLVECATSGLLLVFFLKNRASKKLQYIASLVSIYPYFRWTFHPPTHPQEFSCKRQTMLSLIQHGP